MLSRQAGRSAILRGGANGCGSEMDVRIRAAVRAPVRASGRNGSWFSLAIMMANMRRMMIQADEALLDRARRRAADRGVSVAQLVREALERELGPATPVPDVRCAGAFRSGTCDLARRASTSSDYEPPPFRS